MKFAVKISVLLIIAFAFIFCTKREKNMNWKGIDFIDIPGDPEGYIDFCKVINLVILECNFYKLADSSNVIYRVQSAMWFCQRIK
ncbi:hypothetical protein [Saccharicrinis aurantiacus]|uniref:hypothetical protein n=1 Tax=Saccharicrinis aurantiacus TaxID=1849719 RepID=UPI00249359A4|nr:hypothetical protein [Saccharicrinis aurantiacus]